MSRHSGKNTSNRKNSKNTATLPNKKNITKKDETENVKLVMDKAEDVPPTPAEEAPPTPAGDAPTTPAGDAPTTPAGNAPPTPAGDTPSNPNNSKHIRSNTQSKNPEKTKRILIWISLGVLASFLPLLFSIIRDFACGFNTLKVNYFRDLALIVAAIAANALSCALAALQKYWSCTLSAFSLLIGFVLYYSFRPDEQLNNTLLNVMIVVCIGLLVMNAIIGLLIAREEPTNDAISANRKKEDANGSLT